MNPMSLVEQAKEMTGERFGKSNSFPTIGSTISVEVELYGPFGILSPQVRGGIMKHILTALSTLILFVGLTAGGTLMAAQQKAPKQKGKPATTFDQNIYRQKQETLKQQIRQEEKILKADKKRYGKDHPTVNADRQRLQNKEKALKDLQKTQKKVNRK